MYRTWGTGANIQTIYKYISQNDADRMGNCKRLPKEGDLCLCVDHSGDCFYDYYVIRKGKDNKWGIVFKFGAYYFGKKVKTLTERNFHLLLAKERITNI